MVVDKSTFTLLLDEISEFLRSDDKRVLVILGNAGSGKTLFCNRLAKQMLESYDDYLPLYCYLPRISSNATNHLVDECVRDYNTSQDGHVIAHRKLLFPDLGWNSATNVCQYRIPVIVQSGIFDGTI